jgi:hypothetical protein
MATNSNHVTSARPADDGKWCHLQCLLASHGAPPPTEYDVMEEVSRDYVDTRELFELYAVSAHDASCDCPTSDDDDDDDFIREVPPDFLQNRRLSMLSATELAARTALMRDDSLDTTDTTCPLNETGVLSELSEDFLDDVELAEDIVDRPELYLHTGDLSAGDLSALAETPVPCHVVVSSSSDNTDTADDAWCECPTSDDDDVHDGDVTTLFSELSEED